MPKIPEEIPSLSIEEIMAQESRHVRGFAQCHWCLLVYPAKKLDADRDAVRGTCPGCRRKRQTERAWLKGVEVAAKRFYRLVRKGKI